MRRGRVGGFVDYLDPDDRAFVDQVIRDLDDPYYNSESVGAADAPG